MPELVEARAVIEQAKGVLMRMYRISDEQAFKLTQWPSVSLSPRRCSGQRVINVASGSPVICGPKCRM
ncbi:ANTAR domain-containing protein [Nocardia tengchongensis]|uniref:ANTAR domain-containing protein n=1 Tax=Nocardia tengchongensis TaxID=2055889 RepID=UPI0036B179BB